jgi:uncharacterized protein YbjT (DUF2867 family)
MVTGASGQIGGAVSAQLTERGIPFAALVRDPKRLHPGLAADVRVADYQDEPKLTSALAGVRRLLLIVPDADVELALGIVDAAERAGVEHVVRISAIGASKASKSELLRNHAAGEEHLEGSGLRYTHLRANSFFQNVVWFRPWLVEYGEFYWSEVDSAAAWIDARDVARAATATLTGDGHVDATYELTGPAAVTWTEMAREFGAVLGRQIRAIQLEPDEFVERADAAGWHPWMSREWLNMFTGEYCQPVAARVSSDVLTLTGAEPTSFRAFAGEHAAALGREVR